MLLPPLAENPEEARPLVCPVRGVRDRLRDAGVPCEHLRELSMGMSHDFEVAVEEGATMVRVGTAIFARETPHDKSTPLDLRQQRFQTVMLGYDRGGCRRSCSSCGRLRKRAARERQAAAGRRQLDAVLGEHRGQERNLRNTLLTAQKLADDIKEQAQNEAASSSAKPKAAPTCSAETQSRLDEVQRELKRCG